ncbi:hypothetical protein ACFV2U_39305 [Streptomyces sp. NPDC059697]|uniref:hypothetical protein n=1 Tax=Streptomyces sp. NPDC059697 TaxID=3346912 RepID=UPI0036CDA5D3
MGGILATASLIAGASILGATPASAATTGTCYTNLPCIYLYYNSSLDGSYITIGGGSISNLAGYTFPYAGAGQGLSVKNNAASAQFRAADTDWTTSMTVFYNSGYAGPCDQFKSTALDWKSTNRLGNTYNNDASVKQVAGYQGSHPSGCLNW